MWTDDESVARTRDALYMLNKQQYLSLSYMRHETLITLSSQTQTLNSQ